MDQNDKIQLFEDKRIRTAWDVEREMVLLHRRCGGGTGRQ